MSSIFVTIAAIVFFILAATLIFSLSAAAKRGDEQLHEEYPEGGYLSN